MGDNQRQIIRNEETVVAGTPEQTTVTQTGVNTGTAATTTTTSAAPAAAPVVAATDTTVLPAAQQSTVQTTTAAAAPSERVVAHNVAETVVDPAADKAAAVNWVNKLVWFIIGIMVALLAIRFVLLAAGANENTGFAQLIYGLTGPLVAPFAGLFGRPVTYPGSAGTGVLEFESLVAIPVYLLIGWAITKLADLLLGTNRTTGTVVSETDRRTKV